MTTTHDDAEFSRQMLLALAEGAVREGTLLLEGKSAEEIHSDVHAYFAQLIDGDAAWNSEDAPKLRRDYQETLESEAARYHEAGHFDIAILLHATRVEHWLNGMIAWALERRGFDEPYRRTVIRETQLRAKTGWLWQLLFHDPLPEDLARGITALAESRNAFVHYKWPDVSIASMGDRDKETGPLSATAEELLAALRDVEDRIVFAGRRRALAAAIGPPVESNTEEPLT